MGIRLSESRRTICGSLSAEVQSAYPACLAIREARIMPSEGSVTRWLAPLGDGDPAAIEQLWRRYFCRLVGLARQKLADAPRRLADEEDVALSAFDSFCRNAARGQFPELNDRDGLWRLLVVITARKASHLRRDEARQKRGSGARVGAGAGEGLLAAALSREPDPAFAALAAEQHRWLMEVLGDDELRLVAQCRLEGDSVEAIAERLGYVSRSIKRKLQMIRSLWEKELPK
jgi:DNA-directed RNA polymerase specialized sigma24 family protein